MLALGFADWTFWEDSDPANGFFGQQKVTFDGPNKLILVNFGETELDFRVDVYSAWKEWSLDPNHNNLKYLSAISVIGGDPLPGNRVLGTTFFLENGWRMRTWNGDHSLTVTGNVFTREGEPIFIATTEPVTTTINLNTSTLVETILPQITIDQSTIDGIADAVWNEALADHQTAGSTGEALNTASLGGGHTAEEIANAIWDEVLSDHVTADTTGAALDEILSKVKLLFANLI